MGLVVFWSWPVTFKWLCSESIILPVSSQTELESHFNLWYLPQVVDAQLCPCCSKLVCQPCIKVSGDDSATCYPFHLPASKWDIGILNPKHNNTSRDQSKQYWTSSWRYCITHKFGTAWRVALINLGPRLFLPFGFQFPTNRFAPLKLGLGSIPNARWPLD